MISSRLLLPALCLILLTAAGCRSSYRATADALGMPNAERIFDNKTVTLRNGDSTLVFTPGLRTARINGITVYLNDPAGHSDLAPRDRAMLRAMLTPGPNKKQLKVLIDPGHGGKDIGCHVEKTTEKAIVLDIGIELQRILTERGHLALMTRTDDTYLTLDERCATGVRTNPDAFVSIHVNSADNPKASGIEVYTLPSYGAEGSLPNSPARGPLVGHNSLDEANRLAYHLQEELLNVSIPAPADRGVRHAHFKVLRDTPAPAVLVETGFITHVGDFARLSDPVHRKCLAKAMADALEKAL